MKRNLYASAKSHADETGDLEAARRTRHSTTVAVGFTIVYCLTLFVSTYVGAFAWLRHKRSVYARRDGGGRG